MAFPLAGCPLQVPPEPTAFTRSLIMSDTCRCICLIHCLQMPPDAYLQMHTRLSLPPRCKGTALSRRRQFQTKDFSIAGHQTHPKRPLCSNPMSARISCVGPSANTASQQPRSTEPDKGHRFALSQALPNTGIQLHGTWRKRPFCLVECNFQQRISTPQNLTKGTALCRGRHFQTLDSISTAPPAAP